jgi:DNA mismatch repair ATPase MutL
MPRSIEEEREEVEEEFEEEEEEQEEEDAYASQEETKESGSKEESSEEEDDEDEVKASKSKASEKSFMAEEEKKSNDGSKEGSKGDEKDAGASSEETAGADGVAEPTNFNAAAVPSDDDDAGEVPVGGVENLKEFFVTMDEAAQRILDHGLDHVDVRDSMIDERMHLLRACYKLRWMSDVDVVYTQVEFEDEMRKLQKFRSKMHRLQEKENVERDSDQEESSDDSGGEDDHLGILKQARKGLQYAFGLQGNALKSNVEKMGKGQF